MKCKAKVILFPEEIKDEQKPAVSGNFWTTSPDVAKRWLRENGPLIQIGDFYRKAPSEVPFEVHGEANVISSLMDLGFPEEDTRIATTRIFLIDIEPRPLFNWYMFLKHPSSRGRGVGQNFGEIPSAPDKLEQYWKFNNVKGHLLHWGFFIAPAWSLEEAERKAAPKDASVKTAEEIVEYFEAYGLTLEFLPEWEKDSEGRLKIKFISPEMGEKMNVHMSDNLIMYDRKWKKI